MNYSAGSGNSGKHRSDLWPRWPQCLSPLGGFAGAHECLISNWRSACEKNTPPDKMTGWEFSFENLKRGAGLQVLLLGRMAKAQVKGYIFHRHW